MDKHITEVLNDTHANYLLPFYWQLGTHRDKLREQIAEIESCGIKALCVESRPHKDFVGENWWADMDIILDECAKRGMKVWILDDDHFPTGHANGLIKKKYPERRRWVLIEHHVDAVGPMLQASFILPRRPDKENILLGVYAYPRKNYDETISGAFINLTANVRGDFLYWNIPVGCHRIFYLYKSRSGIGNPEYIDMLSAESVDTLIEAVYEPHFEHYAKYFGNTLAGFFSDEPSFGNTYAGNHSNEYGFHFKTVGMPGLALPWNEDVEGMMANELGCDPLPFLASLWFGMDDLAPKVRLSYMNAVSKLYRDCFCRRIGSWCRNHGVMYIGHIIEDMNSHARLGCSAGHYFRSLDGQDMSGMDIVLHQVMPGMESIIHTSCCSGNNSDGVFYNYVLAKLASSMAHLKPEMHGRAMCEVFGAYGWAENVTFMKWLIDFLLVRGINYFVPHAFSPIYPNSDCPPHFGANGHDPQFDGFKMLMRYTNKAAHLLSDAIHVADAAILYHGEAEWMNCDWQSGGKYMYSQKPAKVLYDDLIDFDIIPLDYLRNANVINSRLCLNNESFGCLIKKKKKNQSEEFFTIIKRLIDCGLPVWFVDETPVNCPFEAEIVPLGDLAKKLRANGLASINSDGMSGLLRIYHCRREGSDIFMLFNESVSENTDMMVDLGVSGGYAYLDLLGDGSHSGITNDGKVHIKLFPYQSCIITFCGMTDLPEKKEWEEVTISGSQFEIDIADSENLSAFRHYKVSEKLFNITSSEELPEFSGKIRYRTTFIGKQNDRMAIDLGNVGSTAELWLNGKKLGERICPPYFFDMSGQIKDGENTLSIIVSNTLANRLKDNFSIFMQIPPSGMLGPVKWFKLIDN